MIFFTEQKLRQALSEPLDVEVALDGTRVTNRNLSALFGNHQDDGVALFGKPKCRTMPQPDRPVEIITLGQGKNATRRHDPVTAQDYPAVMEDRLGMKNRDQKLLGEFSIDLNTALGNGL